MALPRTCPVPEIVPPLTLSFCRLVVTVPFTRSDPDVWFSAWSNGTLSVLPESMRSTPRLISGRDPLVEMAR